MNKKKEIIISNATRDRVEACRLYIESIIIIYKIKKENMLNKSMRNKIKNLIGNNCSKLWRL